MIGVGGQSNARSAANYDSLGTHPAGTYQWAVNNALEPAPVPLSHPSPDVGTMGFDITFADDYRAANPRAALVFVPMAVGGTGYRAGDWNDGDTVYENAVTKINAALAGLDNASLKGMLFLVGENDSSYSGLTEAEFGGYQDAMIAAFRTDLTGGSNVRFVAGQIGQFVTRPSRDDVNNAIEDLPNRVTNTAFVPSTSLTDVGDSLHFDAASLRTLGEWFYLAYTDQTIPVPSFTDPSDLAATVDWWSAKTGITSGGGSPDYLTTWASEISGGTDMPRPGPDAWTPTMDTRTLDGTAIPDFDGNDYLTVAARTDLPQFSIAAGNSGTWYGQIASPGSADFTGATASAVDRSGPGLWEAEFDATANTATLRLDGVQIAQATDYTPAIDAHVFVVADIDSPTHAASGLIGNFEPTYGSRSCATARRRPTAASPRW